MFNSYFFGFAGVAAALAAGLDYTVQAKANGSSPGAFPVSAYIQTYKTRYDGMMADIDKTRRQSELARTHLPEAPEGWERRDYVPDTSNEAELLATMNLLQKRAYGAQMKVARKAGKYQVWEYVRGDEVIRLSANFQTEPEDGAPRVTAFVDPFLPFDEAALSGHAIVQGVPFFRMAHKDTGFGAAPSGPQMLQGVIGHNIAIGVYAESAPETLAAMLDRIDYANLNAMLDEPQPGIGPDAPRLGQEEELARLQLALASLDAPAPADDAAGSETVAAAAPAASQPSTTVNTTGLQGGQALGASNAVGQKAKPGRLQLSGGTSCTGNSAGRLCKN